MSAFQSAGTNSKGQLHSRERNIKSSRRGDKAARESSNLGLPTSEHSESRNGSKYGTRNEKFGHKKEEKPKKADKHDRSA